MTWHLKDRELEKKLIEVCPNFFNELNLSLSGVPDGHKFGFVYVEFHRQFGDNRWVKSKLAFFDREVEYVQDYNPKAWNEYPDVTPPFDKDMRVELDDGLRYCARYHKFSDGCFWVSTNGTCFPNYLNYKVVRFRPWED